MSNIVQSNIEREPFRGYESKNLTIPLENGFAVIQFPMSESDLKLIRDTLNLWEPKLTAAPDEGGLMALDIECAACGCDSVDVLVRGGSPRDCDKAKCPNCEAEGFIHRNGESFEFAESGEKGDQR